MKNYCFLYGLFDPVTKKMLMKPSDWPKGNFKQVQNLIGYSPSFLDAEVGKTYFMLFQATYTAPEY